MVNKDECNRIADLIEDGHYVANGKNWGFNMSEWINRGWDGKGKGNANGKHFCGTTACVAGWTYHANAEEARRSGEHIPDYAANKLGLTVVQAHALFHTYMWQNRDIHPLHAVETLRYLAETGRVDWKAAGSRYEARMLVEEERQREWDAAMTNLVEMPIMITAETEKADVQSKS